jgi:hypothetical protein
MLQLVWLITSHQPYFYYNNMNDETKFSYILEKTGRTFILDDGGF